MIRPRGCDATSAGGTHSVHLYQMRVSAEIFVGATKNFLFDDSFFQTYSTVAESAPVGDAWEDMLDAVLCIPRGRSAGRCLVCTDGSTCSPRNECCGLFFVLTRSGSARKRSTLTGAHGPERLGVGGWASAG